MNKPNIHMFSLYNEFYFYDVNTNAIVKIPQEIYAYLQEIMDGKENLIKSKTIENGIFFLKQKGLLTEQYTESTIHFETELLNDFYKHNLKQKKNESSYCWSKRSRRTGIPARTRREKLPNG